MRLEVQNRWSPDVDFVSGLVTCRIHFSKAPRVDIVAVGDSHCVVITASNICKDNGFLSRKTDQLGDCLASLWALTVTLANSKLTFVVLTKAVEFASVPAKSHRKVLPSGPFGDVFVCKSRAFCGIVT